MTVGWTAAPSVGCNCASASGIIDDGIVLGGDVQIVSRPQDSVVDRRCGYSMLMAALSRLEISPHGASGAISLTEIAGMFAVSRAHVRKLFKEAADRQWLVFDPGGRLTIGPATLTRLRLWFGHEFGWIRRVVAAA